MIFGLAAAAAFYVTKGQLFADIKYGIENGFCGGSSPRPDYEEIGGQERHLLLEQGGELNESARASINMARKELRGSERDVNFKSIIY